MKFDSFCKSIYMELYTPTTNFQKTIENAICEFEKLFPNALPINRAERKGYFDEEANIRLIKINYGVNGGERQIDFRHLDYITLGLKSLISEKSFGEVYENQIKIRNWLSEFFLHIHGCIGVHVPHKNNSTLI